MLRPSRMGRLAETKGGEVVILRLLDDRRGTSRLVLSLARGRWFLTSDVASCVCLLLVLSANDKGHVRVHINHALKWSAVKFEDHVELVKA